MENNKIYYVYIPYNLQNHIRGLRQLEDSAIEYLIKEIDNALNKESQKGIEARDFLIKEFEKDKVVREKQLKDKLEEYQNHILDLERLIYGVKEQCNYMGINPSQQSVIGEILNKNINYKVYTGIS